MCVYTYIFTIISYASLYMCIYVHVYIINTYKKQNRHFIYMCVYVYIYIYIYMTESREEEGSITLNNG